MTDRPVCPCHGKPMWRDSRSDGPGWRCAVKKAAANRRMNLKHRDARSEKNREWYENLSGPEYNRRLLMMRRVKALTRRRERQLRRETEGAN